MNFFSLMHVLLIVYVGIVPLVSRSPDVLGLHVLLLLCLLLHWTMNNDICALTLLEQHFYPGTDRNDLFFQRLVGPVYNVTHSDVHALTILFLLLSVHKYVKYRS